MHPPSDTSESGECRADRISAHSAGKDHGMTRRLAVLGGSPVYGGPWAAWPAVTTGQLRAVEAALRGGQWSPTGLRCSMGPTWDERFTSRFARYLGVRYCASAASGTVALKLALEAANIGWGDVVALPTIAWVAVLDAVLSVGARPLLLDVDQTLCVSGTAFRASLAQSVDPIKCLIAVHANGAVADVASLGTIERRCETTVIEDCSQAHGARESGGHHIGTSGAVGIFSMHNSKLMTAGEGGAFVTNEQSIFERFVQLRTNGRSKRPRPSVGSIDYELQPSITGTNGVLSELQSALLVEQVDTLDERNARIRAHVTYLSRVVKEFGCEVTGSSAGTQRVFSNMTFRLPPDLLAITNSETFRQALVAECGNVFKRLPEPLHRLTLTRLSSRPSWRWFARDPLAKQFGQAHLFNAERYYSDHLLIPHPYLAEPGSAEILEEALRKVLAGSAELRHVAISTEEAS